MIIALLFLYDNSVLDNYAAFRYNTRVLSSGLVRQERRSEDLTILIITNYHSKTVG